MGQEKLGQLITPAYIEEQHILHRDPMYGAGSHRYAEMIAGIKKVYFCDTILDYGAGKGTLAAEMLKNYNIKVAEYDPGVPGKEQSPEPADLVTCIDVMEHIEPLCLDAVIKDLGRLTRKVLLVDIATKFDKHRWLTDGRNSHQIVKFDYWWENEFNNYGFKVVKRWSTGLKAWIALMEPPC